MWHHDKQSFLNLNMKTKVVQHVCRINISIWRITCDKCGRWQIQSQTHSHRHRHRHFWVPAVGKTIWYFFYLNHPSTSPLSQGIKELDPSWKMFKFRTSLSGIWFIMQAAATAGSISCRMLWRINTPYVNWLIAIVPFRNRVLKISIIN